MSFPTCSNTMPHDPHTFFPFAIDGENGIRMISCPGVPWPNEGGGSIPIGDFLANQTFHVHGAVTDSTPVTVDGMVFTRIDGFDLTGVHYGSECSDTIDCKGDHAA